MEISRISQKRKGVTVGVDDFAKFRESRTLWIDKSFLIERFILDSHECNVLLRPRRFGKSLNLSMLKYFLTDDLDPNYRTRLFEGLAITKSVEFCESHMGKYPVISINFKECHGNDWKCIRERIIHKLAAGLQPFEGFVDNLLGRTERENTLEERIAGQSDTLIASLIARVMTLIHKEKKKRVVLLIDEYDAPLNSKLLTDADDRSRASFFSFMYSDALKSNTALFKACLVGVAEIRGAGILSGVNHLGIASIEDKHFADCFGFTQEEAVICLKEAFDYSEPEAIRRLTEKSGINEWYNGYIFGGIQVINPWSFMKYIYSGEEFAGYWTRTSATESMFTMMKNDTYFAGRLMFALQELLRLKSFAGAVGNAPARARLEIEMFDTELNVRENASWSQDKALHFLCMAGYLTYQKKDTKRGEVWIPNREIYDEWTRIVKQFSGFHSLESITEYFYQLIDAFKTFDVERIQATISEKVSNLPRRATHQEYIYQSFICGLLSVLNASENCRSLMETGAGHGFADSTIHFDDINKSIIIEFKKADQSKSLDSFASLALKQIAEKRYFDSTSTDHEMLLLGCAISNDNEVTIASATIGSGIRRDEDIINLRKRFNLK